MTDLSFVAQDFSCFVGLAFHTLTSKRLGNDRYLRHLFREIELFACGKVQRLLVNLPPRHLKTLAASVCGTAWILGCAPSTKVMVVTNGEELSKEIMRKIQSVMRSNWYRAAFKTRLAKGHQAVMNFGTTAGGGVYAASIRGALTGFGADIIIVDDLHHIEDARNPAKMAEDIDLLDTVLISRFDDPSHGRMMCIGHRLDSSDISGHLLAQGGWRHVVLPLIAPRDEVYKTDTTRWRRRKGEFLRPNAWGAAEVEARKARTRAPGFECLYQQNPSQGLRPITAECFPERTWGTGNKAPLVMSVDPGQSGGRNNSFGVVQIWCPEGGVHILIEQWREQSTFSELQKACRRLLRRYRPSAILIENAGQGPALASTIRPEAWMNIVRVQPRASKVERLARHIDLIWSGGIHLAIRAEAQFDYVQEFASFPRCDYDDQIDATTQYLDFMAKRPHLELPPERALASVVTRSTWATAPHPTFGLALGRSATNWPSPETSAAASAQRGLPRRRR